MKLTDPIPVISIGIVSHNHQNFIARAIESVMNQKHNFSYELIIFDDASTDKSPEIINEYFQKYPKIIKPFLLQNNLGPIAVAHKLANEMRGKYCAWLDADDYWTYSSKLNIQIDFLEKNLEYTACFHDALIKSSVNTETSASEIALKQSHQKYRYYSQFNQYKPDFYPSDLLKRNIIPTASLVFRNRDFNPFFNHFSLPYYSFSWALQLHIIKNSKFYYINRCWSVYIDHAQGLSKKESSEFFTLNNIKILQKFTEDDFYKRYKNLIFRTIASEYDCIVYNPHNGKFQKKYARKSQYNHFKAWWYTAWYYLLERLKNSK